MKLSAAPLWALFICGVMTSCSPEVSDARAPDQSLSSGVPSRGEAPAPTTSTIAVRPTTSGETCLGESVTIWATPGGVMYGTAGRDVILGSSGPDEIHSWGGRDRVCAGGGNDQVWAGYGIDRVSAGRGRDTVFGGGLMDVLHGQRGRDVLHGGMGGDVLIGGAARDRIHAARGEDNVYLTGDGDRLFGTVFWLEYPVRQGRCDRRLSVRHWASDRSFEGRPVPTCQRRWRFALRGRDSRQRRREPADRSRGERCTTWARWMGFPMG